MTPTGYLQGRQAKRSQRTGGGIHPDFRIEHNIRLIPGELSEPGPSRQWPLHEAIYVCPRPLRFIVDERTGVVQQHLEPVSIQMRHEAAQHYVPDWMPVPYLAAHDHQTDTVPRRMSWLAVALPKFGCGSADEITISDQRGGHINR